MDAAAQLEAAYAFCRATAKREAKNFYYGFLALPPAKRDAMCAVYSFMRRADDISDDESMSLEVRRVEMRRWLTSWQTNEDVKPQDAFVFLAVRDVQRHFGVTDHLLDELVQGTTMDLDTEPPSGVERVHAGSRVLDQYESVDALERYCYLVASVVGLTTIRIFGYADAQAELYAEQLGYAFQLTNILRDVKEDAERGRVYLPLSLLQTHGVTTEDVLRAAVSGRGTAAITAVLAELAQRAENYYRAADALIPLLAKDSRAAMRVLVRIYHLLLQKMVRRRFQVFSERVRVSTARKLLVLVRGLLGGLLARRGSARG